MELHRSPGTVVSQSMVDPLEPEAPLDLPLTLGQVAEAVGFADAAHLCRVFRRHVGVTPGAHRRG